MNTPADGTNSRLIIVSNRLPVVLTRGEGGTWQASPGSGGLVTAMAPVLRNRGGSWIGWTGTVEKDQADLEHLLGQAASESGYTMSPVRLTRDEVQNFYLGFSNEALWPLFHDLFQLCIFDSAYWNTYLDVNRKFAQVIADKSGEEDFVWVHDYHLMDVARVLAGWNVSRRKGFFLHIPFPPLDVFLKLPWRFEVLAALLEYDILGFQTMRDRRNFLHCVKSLIKGVAVRGKGHVVTVHAREREIRVGTFPISIDFNEFAQQAASDPVAEGAWFIHQKLPNMQIILGVDRLDYTKGIPLRLKAFRNALLRYPELQEKVVLIQVAVPSRSEISKYQELKSEIERLVGDINGQFTRSGWVPIHYICRNLGREELLAYYRTAEIALVTPLKDGMNLVAKEYCAANIDAKGVLILSEFAGAAAQLHKGSLLVNPYDLDGVADAIHRAFGMDELEREARMRRMRQLIKRRDIFAWVNSFLSAAIDRDLTSYPVLEDYRPQFEL
jgi:trehalose 6-phosphate synthase/phosphatase